MFSSWSSDRNRSGSFSSDDSNALSEMNNTDKPIPPPVLVYHESARSIVFRDQVRRAHKTKKKQQQQQQQQQERRQSDSAALLVVDNDSHHPNGSAPPSPNTADKAIVPTPPAVSSSTVGPVIQPLPALELTAKDQFGPILESIVTQDLTDAERDVVDMMRNQRAVVKTIKNADWTAFLQRFKAPKVIHQNYPDAHDDIPPSDDSFPFNSFHTSTSLLPEYGMKMRCFGSTNEYTTGVVFGLPRSFGVETEQEAADRTKSWSWPSGYAAKTEFNIDSYGRLINGRKEALVSLADLRQNNQDYITKEDYEINGRLVKGGLQSVPYNEVFLRVGGPGRIVRHTDCATGDSRQDQDGTGRSLDRGVGLPVALFVRTAKYGHFVSLLRTRARLIHTFGKKHTDGLPLLLITPELGVRVLTRKLEDQLLQIVSRKLNPFQNTTIAHRTTVDSTDEKYLQQKMEELLDLDSFRKALTPEERARLAGGFGATDDSLAELLMEAKQIDQQTDERTRPTDEPKQHSLQTIVNEGLAAAVRSGDYHTSRQLLILYTLVASRTVDDDDRYDGDDDDEDGDDDDGKQQHTDGSRSTPATEAGTIPTRTETMSAVGVKGSTTLSSSTTETDKSANNTDDTPKDVALTKRTTGALDKESISVPPPSPPPPPLDTDRLRSATNSDGLLAVLGAAQVLKAMQDGTAKRRVAECVSAMEEWVEQGSHSMSFRLASWRNQHSAQADLKIAMQHDSNMMAFISNKALSNRKAFAAKLRETVETTNFESVDFLQAIHSMLSRMNSPCLRLELLQYVLELDNRYSVAHVVRSVELAATCLSISTTELQPTPREKEI